MKHLPNIVKAGKVGYDFESGTIIFSDWHIEKLMFTSDQQKDYVKETIKELEKWLEERG